MLGIPLNTDLNLNLTRNVVDPIDYVDAVNAPDIFDTGIIPDAFSVDDIGDGELTTQMLQDAAITTAKLADLSVDTDKLAALAVEAAKLATGAVEASKIAAAAVGSAAIASAAIGTAHIANGAILNAHIADATIQNAKIYDLSADKINAGTLTGRTVKATGGSGSDVWLENSGYLRFRYGGSNKAFIYSTSSGTMLLDGDDNIYIWANDQVQIKYNEDGGSDSFSIYNDSDPAVLVSDSKDMYVDGTVYDNYSFDFAEFYESEDGEKIDFGVSVVFSSEGKIRAAKSGETPFGVVSATAGFILNSGGSDAGQKWTGKYMRNDFGEFIIEKRKKWYLHNTKDGSNAIIDTDWSDYRKPPKPKDNEKINIRVKIRRKIDQKYDESKEYIKRKDRAEWNPIGLVGRVRLKKGQPVAPQWIKMRDVSDSVEEWFIK